MAKERSVLILCTGNSCRSQMAEAFINHHMGDRWKASSAGTQPAEAVHPLALKALAEVGILHKGQPKSVDAFKNHRPDIVITVCDDAAENCPVWLGKEMKVHIPFPDPAKAEGSKAARMALFREVRDAIERDLIDFLRNFDG